MLLRQEPVAAKPIKISGNRIKVHRLGKTITGRVKLQLRRPLKQSKIVFTDKTFVGDQHQHASVTGLAELLQDAECSGGEQHRSRRQPPAVVLQNLIPWFIRVTSGRNWNIPEGELQVAELWTFRACAGSRGHAGGDQRLRHLSSGDDKSVLGKAIENIIGDDDE